MDVGEFNDEGNPALDDGGLASDSAGGGGLEILVLDLCHGRSEKSIG